MLCCVCGVVGHLAPVHRCACSVCCVACAVSWATWLLFTGVPTRCVVLRVLCPGPLGSCSPVCPLCVMCCVCGFVGHLAPVHRCARLVLCFACAVSWVTWLLFTAVPARCVVLRGRCPGPLGSCSPVCALRPLLCLCGVLGHLPPVYRCARSVCCAAGCVCGVACAGRRGGVYTQSIPTAAVCSQQGLGTLRARTRPSGRQLFVTSRGRVPSGRALVNLDGSCSLPAGARYPLGARSYIRTAAVP